jgi:hypothetical protein
VQSESTDYDRRGRFTLATVLLVVAACLIVYSQTSAFVWDEGFHLIAAKLISAGKSPYIDFCFPQTPLNAYWNALLIHFFGEHWQMPHLFAALFVIGSAVIAAEFMLSHFPVRDWRWACAACAAVCIGLHKIVVQFGPVGQAYGICLLLGTAAFRVAVATVSRAWSWLAFMAGLLAGASAASSLLSAPVAPVLLLWLFLYNRAGNRLAKCVAFLAGTIVPFAPVLWLFTKSPATVIFNILQYQTLYRRTDWAGATIHDVGVLSAWSESVQALLVALLAIAGGYFVWKASGWESSERAEFYLAGWLALGLGLFIATAHPTFERYFILMVPFVSILAMAGLYAAGSRLAGPDRPWVSAAVVMALIAFVFARMQYDNRDDTTWYDYAKIAKQAGDVTPAQARLYADEPVYFILQRTPPAGMEFSYSHKLELPPAQQVLLHIIPESVLKTQIKDGKFATVETCKDDVIDKYNLAGLFPNKADVEDCTVFWGAVKHLK